MFFAARFDLFAAGVVVDADTLDDAIGKIADVVQGMPRPLPGPVEIACVGPPPWAYRFRPLLWGKK